MYSIYSQAFLFSHKSSHSKTTTQSVSLDYASQPKPERVMYLKQAHSVLYATGTLTFILSS
jgi:hypothetical protein